MNRTLLNVAFLLLACAACFAQSSFKGLLTGAAARAGTTRAQAITTVRSSDGEAMPADQLASETDNGCT